MLQEEKKTHLIWSTHCRHWNLVTSQTTRALGKLQSDTTGKRPYLKQRQTNGLKRERNTQMQDYKLLYKASTWVILNKLHRKKVVGMWSVSGWYVVGKWSVGARYVVGR